MFDNIPSEMMIKRQWVNYRITDGKKIPINPTTMNNAASNDPATWADFKTAVKRVDCNQASGIGYVFQRDYIAIDLDDALVEGNPKPWAKEIMNALAPAYMEISVSGNGLHIILPHNVDLPSKGLNIKFEKVGFADNVGGFEIYESGRYFIMTGNSLGGNQIIGDGEKAIPLYHRFKSMLDRAAAPIRQGITSDVFKTIQDSVTMTDVLARYSLLAGPDRKICCPFHNENSPSFHVYEKDYYCFGCQKYGDATAFVRDYERLPNNFEAAKRLDDMFQLNIGFDETLKSTQLKPLPECKPDEMEDILAKAFNLAEVQRPSGLTEYFKSGTPTLDKHIGGFGMGQLTVITGLNGSGKSTWLGQLMVEAIEQDYNVFAFSGELVADRFQSWVDMQAAGAAHIEVKQYRDSGREYSSVSQFARESIHRWYDRKFFLYDNKNGLGFKEIKQVMEAFALHRQCRIFLIDNIMRLDLRGLDKDEYQAQSQFINEISDFAQKFNVHVFCVAHPRKVAGCIIKKQDVSGTGDLTNRADNVIAVHRNTDDFALEMKKMYPKHTGKHLMIASSQNMLEIFKNRDFGVADMLIPLHYDSKSKRLSDANHPDQEFKRYGWQPSTSVKTPEWEDVPW